MKYKHLQKLLYKNFDSELLKKEKEILEKALEKSKELRTEREKLITLRNLLTNSSQKSFKPFFEERLIRKLNESKITENEFDNFIYSLVFSFKRIAFAAIIVTVILLSNNFIQSGDISFESALGLHEPSMAEVFDPTYILIGD